MLTRASEATVFDLPPLGWVLIFGIIVVGGFVRGFGGFGSSMVWVAGMTTVLPVTSVVPSALMLEIAISAQLVPTVWREAHWPSLRWSVAGALVGIPIGSWLLVSLPESAVRLSLGVVVLSATWLLAANLTLRSAPGMLSAGLAGTFSGALNSAFAMGGPPMILLYGSMPKAKLVVGRASLIVFFVYVDVFGLALAGFNGLITRAVLMQSAVLLIGAVAGSVLGSRRFRGTNGSGYRRYILIVLAMLSVLLIGQAMSEML